MCGLCGAVAAPGGAPPSRERIEQAVRALTHRGPDGEGYFADQQVAFGHTRLSIIDLEKGEQPMANEDGSVVTVYNGEIWNHLELRDSLERAGHQFRSRADTEVIVHGWEEWGEDLLPRLDGMFAFALWDGRDKRLILARDPMGKKPMYVCETAGGLAFGSDARSVILVSGLRPELDTEHIPEYLFQRYVGAPRTLFRGVRRLRPGHTLVYENGFASEQPYWRVQPGDPEPLDAGELRELLREAAAKRLMSDVPIGVLLSGGVDSAAVLGLLHEAGAEGLSSFTIGFQDPLYDERESAGAAARRFRTEHHELVVAASDFVEALPRLAWYRDEPIAEPSEVPLMLLAELAGAHVKVVLSGDGGDELFGGYPKYRAERLIRIVGPAATRLLALAGRLAARRPTHRRLDRALGTLMIDDELLRWASWFRSFSPGELELLLTPPLREHASSTKLRAPLSALLEQFDDVDAGRRMLLGDLLTYLPDNMLLRADKVLMGASVEGRMPLVDRQVVERLTRVPVRQRAGLLKPKAVLRQALADLVPDETLRAPKRGFPVPVAELLFQGSHGLVGQLLLSPRALDRGIFQADAIRALVEGGRSISGRELKLFSLVALELFLRTNMDTVRLEPPRSLAELLES